MYLFNITLLAYLFSSIFCFSQDQNNNPTHYEDLIQVINKLTDYTEERGNFKVLSKSPFYHIQLSPIVFDGDPEFVIEEETKRAILEGIYRCFIHTDEDEIQVTSMPVLFDFNKKIISNNYLKEYRITVHITRNHALSLLQKLLHVNSFKDLIGVNVSPAYLCEDCWNEKSNKIFFNDQGKPTLDTFFENLLKENINQ